MFGIVPKTIWNRTNPSDSNNLCTWAMRSLLIEDGERLILIDTGCGNKQGENFFKHYYLHGDANLISSIRAKGYHENDVTDVLLTHLHFDHVGGATQYNADKTNIIPTFSNAIYHVAKNQYEWAMNPNKREKPSFLKENFEPLAQYGQLNLIDETTTQFNQYIELLHVNGHTEHMLIPIINYKDKKLAFMADLLPSVGHFPIPYIMSYDVRPLLSMKEKEDFLIRAKKENIILFFQHDPIHECCSILETEKGIRQDQVFVLDDF